MFQTDHPIALANAEIKKKILSVQSMAVIILL